MFCMALVDVLINAFYIFYTGSQKHKLLRGLPRPLPRVPVALPAGGPQQRLMGAGDGMCSLRGPDARRRNAKQMRL